jgi:hypothetical protein
LSVARGVAIIVVCGVCFGAVGGLLGFTLGVGAPAYYRGVFRAADNPGFNPLQVGLGLGVTQGLICGLVIGSVVVLAVALSRRPRQEGEPVGLSAQHVDSRHPRPSRMRRVLGLVAILAAIACGGAIGFVVGAVVGQLQLYQQSTDAKLAKIRPVLRDQRFAGVDAEYSSAAQVYLTGRVGSEQAYKALEERMRFLSGDEETRFMMGNVEVAKE